MPLHGRGWRFVPAVKGRGTYFGSKALVELIEDSAEAVALQFPGTMVEIGNIGLDGGGKIVQSKSHQAGRDVDVAFPALNAKGKPGLPGRFVGFDRNGKGPDGWTLDTQRAWAFVKVLLESSEPAVQWIFLSSGLREHLLAFAREKREPPEVVNKAALVLHQPTDSTDHSDHMHIRIHCNDWDRANGCEEYGPPSPHWKRSDSVRNERIERLSRRASIGLSAERLAALKQLGLLGDPGFSGLVQGLLCDSDIDVVRAAVAVLRRADPEGFPGAVARSVECAATQASRLLLSQAVADAGSDPTGPGLPTRKTKKMPALPPLPIH